MLRANVVTTPGPADERLLLLIHGFGADENDLAPLAGVLDPDGRCFSVCPRGPIDLPYGGAAWYDCDAEGSVISETLQGSILALDHLIDAACEQQGLDRASTLVVGFSQGGAMALAVALRETTKARPAGVACLSGMLQSPEWMRYAWHADDWPAGRLSMPPVYVHHGTEDPLVEVERGRRTRDVLRAAGIEPTYHEFAMEHEITPESLTRLRRWLDGLRAGLR